MRKIVCCCLCNVLICCTAEVSTGRNSLSGSQQLRPCSIIRLEKLLDVQQMNGFPALYENRRFIIVFTRYRRWSYPGPYELSTHLRVLFLQDPQTHLVGYYLILPSYFCMFPGVPIYCTHKVSVYREFPLSLGPQENTVTWQSREKCKEGKVAANYLLPISDAGVLTQDEPLRHYIFTFSVVKVTAVLPC